MEHIVIVMRGLNNTATVEKEANAFFKKQKFGTLKKLMAITTLAGHGGDGGRTDVVFLLTSENIMKFGLSSFRFGSGSSWASDYIVNDSDIIPTDDKKKLKDFMKKYGG